MNGIKAEMTVQSEHDKPVASIGREFDAMTLRFENGMCRLILDHGGRVIHDEVVPVTGEILPGHVGHVKICGFKARVDGSS